MNKELRSVAIQLRTSEQVRDWLKDQATEQDRSVNWILNKIIEVAQAKEGAKKPPF